MLSFFQHKKIINWIFITVLILCACYISFWRLGYTSLNNWDEGMYMNITHELLVSPHIIPTLNHFSWLDKPPLGFWLHACGILLFGENNFGLRFMGGLFFVLSIVLFYFLVKKFYNQQAAFLVSLSLLVSPIWYGNHMIRTGDLEEYFLFFTILNFYVYVLSWSKPRFFWLVGLVGGLSFMTRGYIAVLPIAGIGIHMLCFKKKIFFDRKQILLSALSFFAIVFPWHLYAIIQNYHQFIGTYLNYQFIGRLSGPLEGHRGGPWFYVSFIFFEYQYFTVFILASVNWLLWRIYKNNKIFDSLILIWLAVFFVPLQLMPTKIIWYVVAAVPALHLTVLFLFEDIYRKALGVIGRRISLVVLSGVCLLIFGYFGYNAYVYINSKQILPVDHLTRYLISTNQENAQVGVFGVDTFLGPATDFQWKVKNNFNVSVVTSSEMIKKFDIILTDRLGEKKILDSDQENTWHTELADSFFDWFDKIDCVILSKR